jgi:transcriptional regulator GlxA family with amidase domain
MKIAVLLFDRITALDAVGPYEVLARLPGAEAHWVGLRTGLHRARGGLGLVADKTLDELPNPDIILLPGGVGAEAMAEDPRILAWLRTAHETSTITASVCTGALILAGAGLLHGLPVTSHWAYQARFERMGLAWSGERMTRAGRIFMGAGVSAGIDLALLIASEVAGEQVAEGIQLAIEYDPHPPFDAGHPTKARPEVLTTVRANLEASGRT